MFSFSSFRKISSSKDKKPKISDPKKQSQKSPPSATSGPSIDTTPPSNLPDPRYLKNIPRISPRLDTHVNRRPSRIPTPEMQMHTKEAHTNLLAQGKYPANNTYLKPAVRSQTRQPPDYQKKLPAIPPHETPHEPPEKKISTYRRVTTSILSPCKTPVQMFSRFLMTNSDTAPIPPPPTTRQRALTTPHPTPPNFVSPPSSKEKSKRYTSTIEEEMPEGYWCGRFSVLSDRVLCEYPKLGNDEKRELVLARLLRSCKGEGARRSFFRFREKLVEREKKQLRYKPYAS